MVWYSKVLVGSFETDLEGRGVLDRVARDVGFKGGGVGKMRGGDSTTHSCMYF